MNKKWLIKEASRVEAREQLVAELNISHTLAELLLQRDIADFESARSFFRPQLTALHDPFLMKDMDKAAGRLQAAIQNNENILVYGDYDVDGTTAVALVHSFLSEIYPNTAYYIPDRYTEGYGISFKGVDFAADNNFSLIIALDCGIRSIDKINYAREKGIDFIICDHHLPGAELPAAAAVLDPKRTDCSYPFKELSGCGIGFKLLQAYCINNNIGFEKLQPYLDLVAVSIASDIVPIVDENRILAYYGLQQINESPRAGLKALLELSGCKKALTISDVVFILGPRINAAGRIESGMKAVELLIAKEVEAALETGKLINNNNAHRKDLDVQITAEALQMIEADVEFARKKSTVLFSPQWHKGVIGIVASRVIEKHYRPTILLTESNGKATGSARSVKDFDVHSAIESCSDLLEQFGGHKYAAGLTLDVEKVPEFTQRFEQIVAATIQGRSLGPVVEIDHELRLADITPRFYRILKQFQPFGPGNLSPLFATMGVKAKPHAKIVGTNHLKLDVFHPDCPPICFSAIAFNQAQHLDDIKSGRLFDMAYHVEENEWNGRVSLQLNIKEIRII